MARLNDTSGVENTCPKINSCLDLINDLELSEIDGFATMNNMKIKLLVNTLEEIRTANEELRLHGSNLQNDFDEKEQEKDHLENTVRDLEEEIVALNSQINDLENKIDELEQIIEDHSSED